MKSLILVTGGSRSGKSRFATDMAKRFGGRIVYIATCKAGNDQEMKRRIARHRQDRPAHWKTVESPADPARSVGRLKGTAGGVIIDCLTMYVSDLLMRGDSDAVILRKVRRLCKAAVGISCPVIVVTNEVGSGVVPDHALGRRFRDCAGLANQIAAGCADQVFLLVSGIPSQIKGGRCISYPRER